MFSKSVFYTVKHGLGMPAPSNFSHFWNFGSMLTFILMMQIITGLLLSMHYSSDISLAFLSINHMMRDVNFGWLLRLSHMNGASLFFFFIYLHMARSFYYNGYYKKLVWLTGIALFTVSMAIAFLGYVLPWGQMSFWGATVITNLISAVPYCGQYMVEWVWGGFSVNNATLTRFYTLHFVLPLLLLGIVVLHVIFLHDVKSSNPLGLSLSLDKISFLPYFLWKDIISFFFFFFIFFLFIFFFSWYLMDLENFFPANFLSTPIHIQPEWYFLFAYTILRAIPNKLGGVLGLVMSIMVMFVLLLVNKMYQNIKLELKQYYIWLFFTVFVLLTWLGSKPVEYPYMWLSWMVTFMYFFFFFFFLV